MPGRSMGAMIAITVVLASSVAFAQNGKQGQQKAPTASNKPFDAHDLSGFWDITNIGRPPGALGRRPAWVAGWIAVAQIRGSAPGDACRLASRM